MELRKRWNDGEWMEKKRHGSCHLVQNPNIQNVWCDNLYNMGVITTEWWRLLYCIVTGIMLAWTKCFVLSFFSHIQLNFEKGENLYSRFVWKGDNKEFLRLLIVCFLFCLKWTILFRFFFSREKKQHKNEIQLWLIRIHYK